MQLMVWTSVFSFFLFFLSAFRVASLNSYLVRSAFSCLAFSASAYYCFLLFLAAPECSSDSFMKVTSERWPVSWPFSPGVDGSWAMVPPPYTIALLSSSSAINLSNSFSFSCCLSNCYAFAFCFSEPMAFMLFDHLFTMVKLLGSRCSIWPR